MSTVWPACEVTKRTTIKTTITAQTTQYTSRVRMRYIIGASFSGNNITSWFNNEPYHSPPIALQYSMNAILQSHTTDDHSIQFFNHPLPFSTDTRITQMNTGQTMGFQIAFNIAFCMAFVTPFYVLFYVRERVVKSKHQQFVSGAKVSAYWFANILWDFVTFLLTIICTIITLACFQEDGFKSASDLGRVFVILIIFILAALPITYLSSLLFTAPSSGYTKLALIKIFLGK
ncbi:hypothetical protein QE152_g4857 [Popillia japonica]|uniref:ABC-2 type transporter transmembrane domain-containing protein n=1 Tax=Popillia japonica TaxID=7064 RepID=A0AAW1MZD3_POPJA